MIGTGKIFENGIGITGGTGSGKSTVAKFLRDRRFFVGDADQYARQAIEPGSKGLHEVRAQFGEDFFDEDKLNRKKLGAFIYQNRQAKQKLENIIHPVIHALLVAEARSFPKDQVWFYDAALLYETNTAQYFREVWVIARKDDLRIQSIVERDQISHEIALKRLDIQMKQNDKVLKADKVIWNDGSLADLEAKVEAILESSCIQPPELLD
jgi:dephospho-CoA kinase